MASKNEVVEEETDRIELTQILEIKNLLDSSTQSEGSLVALLQRLVVINITFKALKETDIGRQVTRLRKHSSDEVRRLVKILVRKWKETVDEWVRLNVTEEEITQFNDDKKSPPHQAQLKNNIQNTGMVPHGEAQNGSVSYCSTPPKEKVKDNQIETGQLYSSSAKRLHGNHQETQTVFQNENEYRLYIFKNQKAFSLCNFAQATFLKQPNSKAYTWHISRPGFFYFSNYNGSNKLCQQGQKLAVKVLLPPPQNHATSPELPPQMAAPPPSSGGVVASSPAFPWPFQPREATSPGPAPGSFMTAISPMGPDEGIPFINSNPAVPLPTGEVDSATIRPWSTSGDLRPKQVVGFGTFQRALSYIVLMLLIS